MLNFRASCLFKILKTRHVREEQFLLESVQYCKSNEFENKV
jgi:hypothetical protein